MPDPIERVLQLTQHRSGAGQHQDRADDRPGHPVGLLVQVGELLLYRQGGHRSHQVGELRKNLASYRSGPKTRPATEITISRVGAIENTV